MYYLYTDKNIFIFNKLIKLDFLGSIVISTKELKTKQLFDIDIYIYTVIIIILFFLIWFGKYSETHWKAIFISSNTHIFGLLSLIAPFKQPNKTSNTSAMSPSHHISNLYNINPLRLAVRIYNYPVLPLFGQHSPRSRFQPPSLSFTSPTIVTHTHTAKRHFSSLFSMYISHLALWLLARSSIKLRPRGGQICAWCVSL